MVRNIMGSLLMVGKGDWPVEKISEALAAKDRRAAGPTAAPYGLYFYKVIY
jgi:tRNA pseudouridine38-40 synthase